MDGAEFYGGLNCLKAGIVFADVITTVSPRYAREITTEALGCGLDDRLRLRQDRLVGILNGVDCEEWNPADDDFLTRAVFRDPAGGKDREQTCVAEGTWNCRRRRTCRCSGRLRG